jgi:hypothetical protein
MTRNQDAGKWGGYLSRAKDSVQALEGWPMHEWWLEACAIVEEAGPSSTPTDGLMLHWMEYQHSRDTGGAEHHGSWLSLTDWLTHATKQERGRKLDMVVWQPTHAKQGRKDEGVLEMSCLVLDSDTGVDHLRIHDTLCRAGIAHFGHASPSSTDAHPKWRLVLPLAEPVKGEELLKWPAYYTAARLVLGAAGKVWFDSSCHNRARIWYAGRMPSTSEREVWGSHLVDANQNPFHGWRCLDIREVFARFEFASRIDASKPKTKFTPTPDMPTGTMSPMARARAYIASIPPGADGGTRGPARYKVACVAVVDFSLSDAEAFEVVSEWNARCSPPAPESKVRQSIENARAYAKHEPGRALNAQPPARFASYALTNTQAAAAYRGAGRKDATPEEHDEATVGHAIKAGLSDEEVIATVLSRPDGHAAERGEEYVKGLLDGVREKAKPAPKPTLVTVDRIEIQASKPPIYTLFIGEATVRVNSGELMQRSRLSHAIMEAIHRIPNLPPTKGDEYSNWVNDMLDQATVIQVGEDADTDYGEREEIQHILDTMAQSDDVDRMPDGLLYTTEEGPEAELILRTLMEKLRGTLPAMTRPTLVRHLRALGWTDTTRVIQGKKQRVWRGKL